MEHNTATFRTLHEMQQFLEWPHYVTVDVLVTPTGNIVLTYADNEQKL